LLVQVITASTKIEMEKIKRVMYLTTPLNIMKKGTAKKHYFR